MLQSPTSGTPGGVNPGGASAAPGGGHGLVSAGLGAGPILPPGHFGTSPPGATHLPPSSHEAAALYAAAATAAHHHHQQTHLPHHLHHGQVPPVEPPKPRFLFRMPRVVPNQKEKFESDDLMKRHSREGEVRYTAFRDRPLQERQAKFIQSLREGHTEIAFVGTGFNLVLSFNPGHAFDPRLRQMDFEKEPGKVHIKSQFILNGVCVRWKGYLDMERLDGVGCIEFDEETAKMEDVVLREQVEAYNRRMKEFEEHRKQQQRQLAAFMGQHQAAMAAAAAAAAGNTSAPTVTSASSTEAPSSTMSSSANASSPLGSSGALFSPPSATSPFFSHHANGGLIHPDLLEQHSSPSPPPPPPPPTSSGSSREEQHLELSATVVSSQQ